MFVADYQSEKPKTIPGIPFSHFQDPIYHDLLLRYAQTPQWLVVRSQLEIVGTWLHFLTPSDYLRPPQVKWLCELDIHFRGLGSPVLSSRLTASEREEVLCAMLECMARRLKRIRPTTVVLKLDPVLADQAIWEKAGTKLGFTLAPSYTYLFHVPSSEDAVLAKIHPKRRTNIRKAERKEASFEQIHSLEGLRGYYDLRCEAGLYNRTAPVPWKHFSDTFEALFDRTIYKVFLVRIGGKIAAGQAAFVYGDYVYLSGVSIASWVRAEKIPANDYLQFRLLRWASMEGLKFVDFVGANVGTTDPKLQAIDQFKASWGTTLTQGYDLMFKGMPARALATRILTRLQRLTAQRSP